MATGAGVWEGGSPDFFLKKNRNLSLTVAWERLSPLGTAAKAEDFGRRCVAFAEYSGAPVNTALWNSGTDTDARPFRVFRFT